MEVLVTRTGIASSGISLVSSNCLLNRLCEGLLLMVIGEYCLN